jgi:hypothetical protein
LGIGFTVTSTVTDVPGQALAEGVMVYLTKAGVLVMLVSVCAIVVPDEFENPPATPLIKLLVQANVVPATPLLLVRDILVVVPLQMVALLGVATTTGIGLMVTFTVAGVPEHPLAEEVMVYLTTAATFVILVRVCAIGVLLPFEYPPAVPLCKLAVHEKVVPATLFGFVKVMLVVAPLQIVNGEGVAVTFGMGLMVTSTETGIPGQALALGVIV